MSKLNCWEYKNCDRNTVCSCKTAERFDGFNSGRNGGRICWYVKAITSGKAEKGAQSQKCSGCNFYDVVEKEEGSKLTVFV